MSVGSKRTPEVAKFSVAAAEPRKPQTGGKKKLEFQKPSCASEMETRAQGVPHSSPNSPAVATHSHMPQNAPLCYERLNRASI